MNRLLDALDRALTRVGDAVWDRAQGEGSRRVLKRTLAFLLFLVSLFYFLCMATCISWWPG
jgi:hypothetical protein